MELELKKQILSLAIDRKLSKYQDIYRFGDVMFATNGHAIIIMPNDSAISGYPAFMDRGRLAKILSISNGKAYKLSLREIQEMQPFETFFEEETLHVVNLMGVLVEYKYIDMLKSAMQLSLTSNCIIHLGKPREEIRVLADKFEMIIAPCIYGVECDTVIQLQRLHV